jgi:hypothetical protein
MFVRILQLLSLSLIGTHRAHLHRIKEAMNGMTGVVLLYTMAGEYTFARRRR